MSKVRKKKPQRVKARLSRGLHDLMSQQQLAREWMFQRIRGVYERYGFVPLSTPAVEYLDVLLGSEPGDEATKQIFTVSNPEGEELGLRFDLTVPLARVVAQYRELERPFRRYQVAQVWRGDKPDKGRFREFTQFDLDSVGTKSELADAEILAAGCDTFEALGIERYSIRYSSRKLLEVLLTYAGVSADLGKDVFRVLDKLDKAGLDKVKLELTTGYKDESGDTIRGLGLAVAQVAKIEEFLTLRSEVRQEVVDRLRTLFDRVDGAGAAIATVEKISDHLHALGYGDDKVQIDLSIARGLAYYTGPIFEAVLLDAPQFGSVFGGGRYDGLVKRFSGEDVPAVGASIGVDRLLAALRHLGKLHSRRSTAQVLVTILDPALESEYVALTWELRRAGIAAEIYLGNPKRGLGKQLKYGDALEIPVALILGEDEIAKGIVQIKDMDAGRRSSEAIVDREEWLARRPGQREVPREQLIEELRQLLDTIDRDAAGMITATSAS
ncbi:MAG: histidine--tRNA ligase [Thermoanaerobaculia bacterium]|nr:histidine--tRNA ligase [Thermoanaerobaculia bacterium]